MVNEGLAFSRDHFGFLQMVRAASTQSFQPCLDQIVIACLALVELLLVRALCLECQDNRVSSRLEVTTPCLDISMQCILATPFETYRCEQTSRSVRVTIVLRRILPKRSSSL